MRESKIEAYLRAEVKKLGGLCWKFVSPGMIGVPDRVVVMPGGRIYFVELKAPGQVLRSTQVRRHRELMQRGVMALTLDSTEAVDYWLEAITDG